jgi:transmembrane 9 superfamily protein 2/4
MWAVALILLSVIAVQPVSAFYIPGFTAVSYKDGQQVQLDVNKIFSKNAQLPFAYSELEFVCQPKGPVKRTWLNLGEILRGDRLVSSDFQVSSSELWPVNATKR